MIYVSCSRSLYHFLSFFCLTCFSGSPTDDPEVSKGCPVGLQVVGQSQEEEAIIAIAEIVDRALKAQKLV